MFLRILVVLGLLATASAQSLAEEVDLRVMSFNIRFGSANDGDNSWENRKEIVVDMIREQDPIVIGTQECLDFQADYLVEQLPHFRWFGVAREADGSGERMAVLYRADLISPIESGNFWLSETPKAPGSSSWDSACNRMATWARFHHHASGQAFYLINTHLDHRSEPARQGGSKVVLDFIETLPDDVPLVLTGDFNSIAANSIPYSILIDGGLADAWDTAAERVGPAVTWGAFKAPEVDSDRRIDWIMTRGGIVADRCETVTYNYDGRYPSDHFPVVAHLKIGGSEDE
ncbi:MAG: endonuclease/exonuclease/phosphatase family protein [Candidatus Hydrogenedentes bacterium]|nr:endonuclease/exonuclease/phosphatase family protein [Candidatus Hydrogenedentota bacterium]